MSQLPKKKKKKFTHILKCHSESECGFLLQINRGLILIIFVKRSMLLEYNTRERDVNIRLAAASEHKISLDLNSFVQSEL